MELNSRTSIEQYVERFGSDLAIAGLLAKMGKDFALWRRAEESLLFFRDLLSKEESGVALETWAGLESDLETAFVLLSKQRRQELNQVNALRCEVISLGRVGGTEPATDDDFAGLGLDRPSSETIDRFFDRSPLRDRMQGRSCAPYPMDATGRSHPILEQ